MADGELTIGFDGSELTEGLKSASRGVEGLVAPLEAVEGAADGAAEAIEGTAEASKKTGEAAKGASNRFAAFRGSIAKVFGSEGALNQKNMRVAFSSMRTIIGGSRRIAVGMNKIADSGASAGDKINAGMDVAASAVAAFATGGPIALALTVVASLAQQISIAMSAAEKEAKAAQAAFESMAEAAASASKSIRLMQLEEQKGQALVGLRALEGRRMIAQMQMEDAKKLVALQNRLQKDGDERFNESERARQLKRAEGNQKAIVDLNRSIEQQQKGLGFYAGEVQAQMSKDAESAVQKADDQAQDSTAALAETIKKLREARKRALKPKKAKAAPEPDDPIDAYAAYYKAQVEEQKRFLAEERAIEDQKAQEEASRSSARIEQAKNEASLIAEIGKEIDADKERRRKLQAEADKAEADRREQKIRAQLEIGRVGLQTITGTLFEMAKAGEVSAQKLLQATLSSIGQHMVAQGTQFIFEGAARTLLRDPSGPGLVGVGLAEVAAGLSLGAASGAIGRSAETSNAAAPAQSPADTRQTQAAASGESGQSGPVIINFQGDVYDKRGVAQVLNSGLSMAKHRRIRGA